jgi:undecaprenyl-diphosphatase
LAIPTIFGALVFLIGDMVLYESKINIISLVIGFFSSSIVAFLTIKYFLIFVEKIGMYPFVIYRVLLGLLILILI